MTFWDGVARLGVVLLLVAYIAVESEAVPLRPRWLAFWRSDDALAVFWLLISIPIILLAGAIGAHVGAFR